MKKKCSWCFQSIDDPVRNLERRFNEAGGMEVGKQIYYAIMDKRFKSIDLCNFDYSLLSYYRFLLKEANEPPMLDPAKVGQPPTVDLSNPIEKGGKMV